MPMPMPGGEIKADQPEAFMIVSSRSVSAADGTAQRASLVLFGNRVLA